MCACSRGMYVYMVGGGQSSVSHTYIKHALDSRPQSPTHPVSRPKRIRLLLPFHLARLAPPLLPVLLLPVLLLLRWRWDP